MGSRSFFGAERANIDLLWRMQARGAFVKCLVRHEDWSENLVMRNALTSRNISWERAAFPDYPSIRYWRYWPRVAFETPLRYVSINRSALRIIRQEGITHIHLSNPFQAASLYSAIERSNVAVIYRCGESPSLHNAFYRRTWAWLARRTDLIVTESTFVRSQLLEMGVDEAKMHLIRTPPPARAITDGYFSGLAQDRNAKPVFCYVRQLSAAKGVRLLLDAFATVIKSFPQARLLLAGPILDDYAHCLISEWSYLSAQGSIRFLGTVEDIPGLLRECDVHVAPSVRPESYGLVAVEAKDAGLPSIVFAEGGLGELVEDGREGIALSEKTPRALAEAMLTYCRNPERAQADGARAQASLKGRLQIDRHDDSWWESYHQTSGNRQCAAA